MNRLDLPTCRGCGRLFIITESGYKICPTEDFPESESRTFFDSLHDGYFKNLKRAWYPDQSDGNVSL